MTKCSTSHSSKCKHVLLFQPLVLQFFGQEKRTQSHGGPAALPPLPRAASKFLTRSGRTAAGSGHRRVLHLVENPLSSPVLSQPPNTARNQPRAATASPSTWTGDTLDLQGLKIPPDSGQCGCTFYAAWVMTLVWSNPSLSPEG